MVRLEIAAFIASLLTNYCPLAAEAAIWRIRAAACGLSRFQVNRPEMKRFISGR
jgi:hypothetical protein